MRDLISRQAAIDDIWTVSPLAHLDREWIDRWLRQLPPASSSEIPNSSDTISRAKAIEALDKRFDSIPMEQTSEILMLRKDLREVPPAQPKRGKWIHISEEMWKCDQCGEISCCSPNFCPDCGADMREVTT